MPLIGTYLAPASPAYDFLILCGDRGEKKNSVNSCATVPEIVYVSDMLET